MTKGADGDESPSGSEVTCAAMPVDVEGKQAVWIFTEFETSESLKTLRDWLIPDHWPDWGGEMFKEMRPIGSLDLRPTRVRPNRHIPSTSKSSRSAATGLRRSCGASSSRRRNGLPWASTSTAASGTCSKLTVAISWSPMRVAGGTSRL